MSAKYSAGEFRAEAETPMSVDEVRSAMKRFIENAENFIDGEVADQRAKATRYYNGEPFGADGPQEEEGRSQVVLTEVRDVITAIMPSVMEVITGGERIAEFRPRRQDTVKLAQQMTEFICDIVMMEDNPGFLITHSWLKDAFLRKLGIVMWWWEDGEVTAHILENADEESIQILAADETVAVGEITKSPYGGFRVEYTRQGEGRARFECIPTEEFLFDSDARDHQKGAACVTRRTEKTRSDLIALGIKPEIIDEHGLSDESKLRDHPEQVARTPLGNSASETTDPAMQKYIYCESFAYIDADGDGIAELRKVCTLGPGYFVVNGDGKGEPTDERPFAVFCPDPEPHTILGLCPADYTMDLQRIGSSVFRAVLDSLAQSIFPRKAFMEGEVNVEDLLSTGIGDPIRTTRPPGEVLAEYKHEFTGANALPIMEKLETIKENRTGISKAAAGLNADSLQSSTQAAVAATVTAKQKHIQMFVRLFAETGLKQLMKGLLRLVVNHQPRERIVRLRGEFVTIDPRSWDADLDVQVNVALGAGLPEQRVNMLMAVAAKQEQILQMLGPANPLCSLGQLRYTYERILQLSGFKDVDSFFRPVDPNWVPPESPAPPDPNMVIAQAEVMKAQAEVAKKQAEIAAKGEELQQEMAAKAQELAFKERELAAREQEMFLTDAREREKMINEFSLKERELELKYNAQLDLEYLKQDGERERKAMELDSPPRKRKVTTKRDPETGALTAESEEVSEG